MLVVRVGDGDGCVRFAVVAPLTGLNFLVVFFVVVVVVVVVVVAVVVVVVVVGVVGDCEFRALGPVATLAAGGFRVHSLDSYRILSTTTRLPAGRKSLSGRSTFSSICEDSITDLTCLPLLQISPAYHRYRSHLPTTATDLTCLPPL